MHILISPRHSWVLVAPFRGIYIMIYHFAFSCPGTRCGDTAILIMVVIDDAEIWLIIGDATDSILTRIQSSYPITRFLHNWPLTGRWSHSNILAILLFVHTYLYSVQHTKCTPVWIYIPKTVSTNLLATNPPWLDDANDIIHTENVSTKNFPSSRRQTARHGCDIHDMLHFSREARGMAVEYSTCVPVPGTAFRMGFKHLPNAATSNDVGSLTSWSLKRVVYKLE